MPRNVIFVAPFPSEVTMRFVRAAARLDDVRLLGVVHTPPSGADANVYHDFVRVTEPLSEKDTVDGCEVLRRRHGQPTQIIGILEALQVQIATARVKLGVPGTPPEVAELFRDKSKMKAALRAAGLPVARSRLVGRESEARDFAAAVGFPIVLKPPAGMGAKSTFRLRHMDELIGALQGMGVSPDRPVLLEEFLRGEEFSFETLTLGGEPQMHSISRYLPTCLHALENPWIKWCNLEPRDISGPEFDEIRKVGYAAVKALGLSDGMTHMEWFRRPDGSVAIGEIAQRPPGANISLMTGLAHGQDIYRAWVRAVVDGVFDGPWERKYAVGSAFLRGPGHGRVSSVKGVHEVHQKIGHLVAEANLPTLGAPKADGYEGDGYIVVRDPDTDVVADALKTIIQTVQVGYSA
jgi:D-alanine-D-alanine ligase-like ATP-grasp enzyme